MPGRAPEQPLPPELRVPNEPPMPLPADPRLLARAEIWNLATDAGDLDITTRPDGTDGYEDLQRGAYRQPLADGLHVAIASLQDIIRSKTAAGRAKDLAALPQLRAALKRQQDVASEGTGALEPPRGSWSAIYGRGVAAAFRPTFYTQHPVQPRVPPGVSTGVQRP